MTKTIKDYFKEFEDKVAVLPGVWSFVPTEDMIHKDFDLVKRFIKAQHLENQRDLWDTTVNLLNASKAFNGILKERIREDLLADCFKELENLNNTILQLANKPDTTVEGNSEKANKPDTAVKGNAKKAKKANKPDAKFNWQGTQTELVYLIEQLYKHGFLSAMIQPDKHRLTAQHFTVKGKNLNQKNLAKARDNNLKNRGGKPKGAEKIEQIISAAKKQNP